MGFVSRIALASTAVATLAAAALGPADAPELVTHDNATSSGTLSGGELTLALEIRPALWHPVGKEHAPVEVLAFGEAGKASVNPGPFIRVPLGTRLRISVRNLSDTVMIVRGLAARRTPLPDTLVLAAGETREARFVADAPGTYFYTGARARPGAEPLERDNRDAQLNGAFVVDPPDGGPRTHERVFVVSEWLLRGPTGGIQDEMYFFNGRAWPLTERFTFTMGDSVHWRFVNSTDAPHPFHLHGFYYRVESRGDMQRDSLYWPAEQRMAVTERMSTGETMAIAWSPDRPGGWLFHCHFPLHVTPNLRFGPEALSPVERRDQLLRGHPDHDPDHHVETGMGGLMMQAYVRPAPDWKPYTGSRRTLRLLVQREAARGDSLGRMAYVLQEGAEPAPDSVRMPGSTIVLHRGEPTTIWVVNRSDEPTAVHWHGMELESPFDGVVGVGGYADGPARAIMPGDSFPARMTPPRSGSFMYHTHVNDIRQLRGGLWGPLLVLEPGQRYDPDHDLVYILGQTQQNAPTVNGHRPTAPTRTLRAGETYRFRLMNIAVTRPGVYWQLVSDNPGVRAPEWRLLARDGHDVPAWQRTMQEPRVNLSIGETADFELVAPLGALLALELRAGGGLLLFRQQLEVASGR